ncbi:MAG: hypothetical protein K0R00_250 [Herbinix sp.]|nr:hypothetical protein [Herbinix sp.]
MRTNNNFYLIDIKSDCIDMIISSYTLWLNNEYRYLFTECLGFKIDHEQNTWGNRIIIDKGDLLDIAIREKMLKAIQIKREDLNLSSLIDLTAEYSPILIKIDEYKCKWRKNYKKIHKNHFLLVTEYTDKSGVFRCIDTYPTDYNLILSYDEIRDNSIEILCIDSNVGGLINKSKHLFDPIITKLQHKDYIGTMLDRKLYFAQQIRYNFEIKDELYGYENLDIIEIPIVRKFKSIAWSWHQIKYLLEYMNDCEMNQLFNILEHIIIEWEKITNILVMKIIRLDSNIINISNKIIHLVEMENNFINEVINYMDGT